MELSIIKILMFLFDFFSYVYLKLLLWLLQVADGGLVEYRLLK